MGHNPLYILLHKAWSYVFTFKSAFASFYLFTTCICKNRDPYFTNFHLNHPKP